MEIAESEFLDIRKARTQYEKSVEVRVLTKAPDIAVDAVSLRTFVEQDPILSEIDRAIANSIGASEIYQPDSQWLERASKDAFAAGMQKLQDLRALLFTYQTAIPEYVGRMQKVWPAATKFSIPAGVCHFSPVYDVGLPQERQRRGREIFGRHARYPAELCIVSGEEKEKLFQSNCLIRAGGFLEAEMITSAAKKLMGKAEMTVSPLGKSVCVVEIFVSAMDIIASCI